MIRESPAMLAGVTLIGDLVLGRPLKTFLLTAGRELGLVEAGPEVFEVLRIEAGTPVFGKDLTDKNLPQELGRDARAISFVKGCYLGQETVARLDALGHVNQLLRGLVFETGLALPRAQGGSGRRRQSGRDGHVVGVLTAAERADCAGDHPNQPYRGRDAGSSPTWGRRLIDSRGRERTSARACECGKLSFPMDQGRLMELLSALVDLPRGDRAAFLDRECGGDRDLRRGLDELIAAFDGLAGDAKQPLPGGRHGVPDETASGSDPVASDGEHSVSEQPVAPEPSSLIGSIIAGRYKLRQEIGEGGMGSVYLAEQIHPVKRRVALKLIKVGMDTRAVLAGSSRSVRRWRSWITRTSRRCLTRGPARVAGRTS